MNEKALEKLDDFLLNCEDISQEEREDIMEHTGYLLDEDTEPHIVFAVHEDGFQEYVDADGKRIPDGEPIGIEVLQNGVWLLKLLDGVFFSPEPFNDKVE